MTLHWFLSSSVLICAILLLRRLLRGQISPRLQYALWLVVLVRLLIPGTLFSAPVSLAAVSELSGLDQAADKLHQEITPTTQIIAPSPQETPLTPEQYAQTFSSTYPWFSVRDVEEWQDQEENPTFSQEQQRFLVTVDQRIGGHAFWEFWWQLGLCVVLAALFLSNLGFYCRLRRRRRPLALDGVSRPVYVTDDLPSPCLFGLFRPAIYLTPQAAADETIRRHVLAHELTHCAHLDHIWSVLRCLCLALHWYNPLVWLAVLLSKRDGELACDEGAVQRLGEHERLAYGRTLLDMVARRKNRPADLLSCSTAMTAGKKTIQQRIQLLVKHPETAKTALFAAVAAAALAVVFTFSSAQTDYYTQFCSRVDAAEAISVSPPLYSSLYYPDPITDSDLLDEAKNLLSHPEEISSDPTKLDSELTFGDAAYTSFRLGLGQDATYYLFFTDNKCYVLLPKDPDSTLPEQWHYVAILSNDPRNALLSLAGRQYNRSLEQTVSPSAAQEGQNPAQSSFDPSVRTALTAEELAWFNEGNIFDDTSTPRFRDIRNQFLTCFYQHPEDIDLYQLFYNGSFLPQAQEVTQQEWNDLTDADEIGVWPTKITASEINEVLQTYTGLTLDQTNQIGLNYWLYLPQYDAYYAFHSDTNYIWDFQFTSGYRQGDMVTLFYKNEYLGMGSCAVVLREVGDSYQFYANRPIPPEWTNLTTLEFMEQLETKYICSVTAGSIPAQPLSLDQESLVWLIHQSMGQPVHREYRYEQHGVYALSIYVVGTDGQSYVGAGDNELHLSVGNEENVVCFYYQYSADQDACYVFVESPQLYQTVRALVRAERQIYAPDYVHALSTLLLENPEARTLNQADAADSEYDSWLREPHLTYTVQYGIPFRHEQACWYAIARSGGGSTYQILIPDSMVDQILAHCRLHDDYTAQEAVLRTPEYAQLMDTLLLMVLNDPELMAQEMDSNNRAAQEKWTAWLDRHLGDLDLSVKHDPYRDCYLVSQTDDFLTIPAAMLSREAVLTYPYEPTNIFIDGDSASPQVIAQQFAQELARRYLALDSRHPKAVSFAQPDRIQIHDEINGAFLAEVHLAVDPVEINSLWWAAGAGLEPVEAGPLAGYYDLCGQYRLVLEQDGRWHCTAYESYGGPWGLRADGLSQGY